MTEQEIDTMKYEVCCPMCDNKKCVRGTDKCEAEIWAKKKERREEFDRTREEELKRILDRYHKNSYYGMWPGNKYCVAPKEVIFQDEKTTIINWTDDTKTIVKCSDDDVFSPEAGVALCYMKKFVTDNDSERFHRILKSLISVSKFKSSKKENNSSGLATIKEAVNIIYALEENHDIVSGASDNSGDNDPDGSAVEVES